MMFDVQSCVKRGVLRRQSLFHNSFPVRSVPSWMERNRKDDSTDTANISVARYAQEPVIARLSHVLSACFSRDEARA